MNKISVQKILIAFLIIFLLSRSRKIVKFFSELDCSGILTLEPLRESPEQGRFFVTVLLFTLIFVTVFWFLNKRK